SLDLATGVACCGSYGWLQQITNKTEVSPKLSHYVSGFLKGEHEFKFGAQIVFATHKAAYGYPGGGYLLTYNGSPYLKYFRDSYVYGSTLNKYGFFAEDVARFNRLTVMLGVRADHNPVGLPPVPNYNNQGEQTGSTSPGQSGTFFTWNSVSPRLGINY